ncbi:MAG: HU family DNA-binding protein [Deltaproteobacteria bacterium]|nr:HU family DNA-binding protein [Deltaproteobacteria bacterium]
MNKAQLVDQLSKDAKLTKAECERVLNSFVDTIRKSLKKGQDVKITGFGRWYVSKRKARAGRNPQTGATIKIPASKVPAWKSGKEFRKHLN